MRELIEISGDGWQRWDEAGPCQHQPTGAPLTCQHQPPTGASLTHLLSGFLNCRPTTGQPKTGSESMHLLHYLPQKKCVFIYARKAKEGAPVMWVPVPAEPGSEGNHVRKLLMNL